MKHTALLVITVLSAALPLNFVQAQNMGNILSAQKPQGMKHMSITPTPAKPEAETAAAPPIKAEEKPEEKVEEKPAPKPLKPSEQLIEEKDLKNWPHLNDILGVNGKSKVTLALNAIKAAPGEVPPRAMIYAAKAYADKGDFRSATFWLFAAQLRGHFDELRWPVANAQKPLDEEFAKEKAEEEKKTEDQRQNKAEKTAKKAKNPHSGLSLLVTTMGGDITEFAGKNPQLAMEVMNELKEWEQVTPYAYNPGYDLPQAAPYKEWPKLLEKARADYFTRADALISGLQKMR